MSRLEIVQVPVLNDNYVYLARCPETGQTAVVDPAVSAPVLAEAETRGWSITHILNTHHHNDHVGGNLDIQAATGCTIVGPRADRDRIPGIQIELGDGELFRLGNAAARIFDVPGHTRGHIAYWFEGSDALFCGDTLFALGCGRLFEGTPSQMWASLSKFSSLPDTTRVFCAHEYTQANARFALTIETDNAELHARARRIDEMRAENLPTVPSTLGEERATNPFLRADIASVAAAVGLVGDAPEKVFGAVRQAKDQF